MNASSSNLWQNRLLSAEDSHGAHRTGLRTVALLEMLKGLLALAGAVGLFTLRHRDMGDVAENIVESLHLNPAHRAVQALIAAADRVSEKKILAMICVALVYAIIRFVEAYGLWRARAWAEWFAIISGSVYLPWEILEVIKHNTQVRWAVLIINIIVVLYMMYVRWDEVKGERFQGTA
jgi:uncharacterized membrane protein (DUF2068 family)